MYTHIRNVEQETLWPTFSRTMLPEKYQKAVIEAFNEAEYQEIYGLNFSLDPSRWGRAHENVLRKFLTANDDNVAEAKTQLLKTLKWRKEFKPLDAAKENFDEELTKLGVVTQSPSGKAVTWNLYGIVKDPGQYFAEEDVFIRWRVGLHERALALLDFADDKLSTMDQVHDYMGVSFLRMDSRIKKTSKRVIEMFQLYYPETLSGKYFVNVPYIMMWVFKLVQGISSAATMSKFHVLASGNQLAGSLGDWIPKEYGGSAETLQSLEVSDNVISQDNVD